MEEWETFYTEETIEQLKQKYRKWNTAFSVIAAVLAGSGSIIYRFLPDGWDAISFVDKNGVFHFVGKGIRESNLMRSLGQIFPYAVLKILEIRQYSCVFFPCLQKNLLLGTSQNRAGENFL